VDHDDRVGLIDKHQVNVVKGKVNRVVDEHKDHLKQVARLGAPADDVLP